MYSRPIHGTLRCTIFRAGLIPVVSDLCMRSILRVVSQIHDPAGNGEHLLFLSIPWFVAARRVLRSNRFIPFTRTVALSILGYPMLPSYYFGKPLTVKAVVLYSFHPLVSTVATAVA
jgi:hypothetical protein